MEKMIMTQKLANALMDDLFCLAISATGGAIQTDDGEYHCSEEQIEYADKYARETFCSIADSWEELMDKKWSVEA